ncbi:MAG: hypothetical protein IJX55_08390 [Clostridia bacterium]|nr:hypothetical protein [Clostridia bacterium]
MTPQHLLPLFSFQFIGIAFIEPRGERVVFVVQQKPHFKSEVFLLKELFCAAGEQSLLLREQGDRQAVDEEFLRGQNTSSVSLRLPPSPTGEGY